MSYALSMDDTTGSRGRVQGFLGFRSEEDQAVREAFFRQLDTRETYDIGLIDEFLVKTKERKEWSRLVAEILDQGDSRQKGIARGMTLCGSIWLRNVHENGGKRYQTMYCGRRWCPICANRKAKQKAAQLIPYLMPYAEAGKISMVTLTLKNTSEVALDKLWDAWRKLTRSGFWQGVYQGALANIEITVDERGLMHWHLHALCIGEYMDRKKLSEMWKVITGDSFIVKIKQVRDLGKGLVGAVFESVKYVAKGSDMIKLGVQGFLRLEEGIAGRRLTSRQGVLAHLPKVVEVEEEESDEESDEMPKKAKGKIVRTDVLVLRGNGFETVASAGPDVIGKYLRGMGLGRLAVMLDDAVKRSDGSLEYAEKAR